MFENLQKTNPNLAGKVFEALDYLKNVAEPSKSKILIAFEGLSKLADEMKTYKKVDSLMDDSASDLTLLSGVDVRKDGVHKALTKVIHSTDQARAIMDTTNWQIAKVIKEYLSNE